MRNELITTGRDVGARRRQLVEYLGVSGYSRFADLARVAKVSTLTIRRDLKTLARESLVRVVPGGALPGADTGGMIHFRQEVSVRREEKQSIARAAAEMVADGDSILIDGGTTTYYLAQALRGRRLHVATNSLPVAEVLGGEPQVEVILLGGIYYPRTALTMGPQSERELRELSPRFLFMGVHGVGKDGFTNSNPQLVRAERIMMEVAEKTVILADSSKFGRRAMARLAGLGDADALVTDGAVLPRDLETMKKAGLAVRVAGKSAGRRN